MAYTEKYCVKCSVRLSGKDQSPEATAFLNACRSMEGNTVRTSSVIIEEDGACFACGKRDQVMYYEL
jgi:hypothetical protein